MRKTATWFALASLAFTASGLALALHNHECACSGEHHDHQDCVQHFAFQVGFGAQLAAPAASPGLYPLPYARPLFRSEPRAARLHADAISLRGPPSHSLAVA